MGLYLSLERKQTEQNYKALKIVNSSNLYNPAPMYLSLNASTLSQMTMSERGNFIFKYKIIAYPRYSIGTYSK